MDYDAVMLYVKQNPDCSSLDIAEAFGVTVAKAFTFMNKMIEIGLAYKTTVRSPTNNKKILGYRVIDGFDEIYDNEDGSIPRNEALNIIRRQAWLGNHREAYLQMESMNTWRAAHGVPTIDWSEVLSSTYSHTRNNNEN